MAGKTAKKATKKSAAKPKKAAPKTASKASLVKSLHAKGIPVPEGAVVADLQHRLKYWKSGGGYNVRLYRGWGSQYDIDVPEGFNGGNDSADS